MYSQYLLGIPTLSVYVFAEKRFKFIIANLFLLDVCTSRHTEYIEVAVNYLLQTGIYIHTYSSNSCYDKLIQIL